MSLSPNLLTRSQQRCELCSEPAENFGTQAVPGRPDDSDDALVVVCSTCRENISNIHEADPNYFRFLTGSVWSEIPSVKVLSYNLLLKLKDQDWAQLAIDGAYLTEEELTWALAESEAQANEVVHKDAYGMVLNSGDTVFLTESLNVKGSNIMAAKGTKVAKIKLVPDNAEQIEGKIEGSTIVILTKFVRKANA
ncbi:MAG: PhnA domain-containing protein [Saprospiraceae bacterium]|nr:PhnA domain-containing protein [Saprospiraceae bacterium]